MKIKKMFPALAAAVLIPLAALLGSCQLGQSDQAIPAQIRKVEISGNQINIFANQALQAGVYIQPSPPKLSLTIENADLVAGIPASGEATDGMIKTWQLSVVKGQRMEGKQLKAMYSVRLTADLTKNVTYQITNSNSGCKVELQEIKAAEKGLEPTQIEIPKELYPKIQKMSVGPGGTPTGVAVAPVTAEDEKAARDMLKEIVPEKAIAEKIAPATALSGLTYRTVDHSFEVVVTGDGEFLDFKVNSLNNPVRIYLDVFGVKSKLPHNFFQVNTGTVRQIRVGEYPDKTRVVVELKGPIKDARVVNVKNKILLSIVY